MRILIKTEIDSSKFLSTSARNQAPVKTKVKDKQKTPQKRVKQVKPKDAVNQQYSDDSEENTPDSEKKLNKIESEQGVDDEPQDSSKLQESDNMVSPVTKNPFQLSRQNGLPHISLNPIPAVKMNLSKSLQVNVVMALYHGSKSLNEDSALILERTDFPLFKNAVLRLVSRTENSSAQSHLRETVNLSRGVYFLVYQPRTRSIAVFNSDKKTCLTLSEQEITMFLARFS